DHGRIAVELPGPQRVAEDDQRASASDLRIGTSEQPPGSGTNAERVEVAHRDEAGEHTFAAAVRTQTHRLEVQLVSVDIVQRSSALLQRQVRGVWNQVDSEVALLDPGNLDERRWIGYTGRHAQQKSVGHGKH